MFYFITLTLLILIIFLNSAILKTLIFLVTLMFLVWLLKTYKYKNSTYYKQTGIPKQKALTNKGSLLEYKICLLLEKLPVYKKVLLNIYLPYDGDKTKECDIIFICSYGVFVIESKNLFGNVYGNSSDRFWSQEIFDKTYSFYNPVKQNVSHIKSIIKNIIIYEEDFYKSLIVFGVNTNIENIFVDKDVSFILKYNKLKRFFRKQFKSYAILDKYQIDEIYKRLEPYNKVSKKIKKKHIKNVKKLNKKRF